MEKIEDVHGRARAYPLTLAGSLRRYKSKSVQFRIFYREYGKALHIWSSIEHGLGIIYLSVWLLNGSKKVKNDAILLDPFLSITNFRERVKFLRKTYETNITLNYLERKPSLMGKWSSFEVALNKRVRDRNKISHMFIYTSPYALYNPPGDMVVQGHSQHMLSLPQLPANFYERKKLVVTSQNLIDCQKSFVDFIEKMREFEKFLLKLGAEGNSS